MDQKRSGDKRVFHRAQFRRAIRLRTTTAEVFAIHMAQDISQGGVRANVNQFIPLGTRVGLQVQLEDMSKLSDFEAIVVWVRQIPYSDMYQVGLEFSGGDSYDKWKISRYVAKA